VTRHQRRFTLKLALKRGISHDEFLRTTSAREVAEYQALNSIDPLWDGERLERAIGGQTSLIYNVNRSENADATTVADWIPDYAAWLTTPTRTDEEVSDEFDRWYAAQQVKDKRKDH
jgi:hypothetical protein